MVAVVGQAVTHAGRLGGVRQRVVEREERGAELPDQRVQAPDVLRRPLVAVVPRKDVGHG